MRRGHDRRNRLFPVRGDDEQRLGWYRSHIAHRSQVSREAIHVSLRHPHLDEWPRAAAMGNEDDGHAHTDSLGPWYLVLRPSSVLGTWSVIGPWSLGPQRARQTAEDRGQRTASKGRTRNQVPRTKPRSRRHFTCYRNSLTRHRRWICTLRHS